MVAHDNRKGAKVLKVIFTLTAKVTSLMFDSLNDFLLVRTNFAWLPLYTSISLQ